jgi:hypothetical protein
MNAWLWDRGKFMNRKFVIQEHYQKFLDGEEFVLRLKKEEDPFWEATEDLYYGFSNFFLQSLVYCMDFEDKTFIVDHRGEQIGTALVNLIPCNSQGTALDESAYTDNSSSLLNKPFYFKVKFFCKILRHFMNLL